jgi:hypothetical protein
MTEMDLAEHNKKIGDNTNGEQEQHQVPHRETADGYTADVSSASKSGNDNDLPNSGEDKLGLVIEIFSRHAEKTKNRSESIRRRAHRTQSPSSHFLTHSSIIDKKRKRSGSRHSKRSRRKRGSSRREHSLTSKPAPSPIHPEIDISLTQHVAVKNGLLCPTADAVLHGAVVSHGGSSSGNRNSSNNKNDSSQLSTTGTDTMTDEFASSVPALSNAILQYFSDLRREMAVSHKKNSKSINHAPERQPSNAPASKTRRGTTSHTKNAPKAQLISDVATFSNQPYRLEEALDITNTPRYCLQFLSFRELRDD